MSQAKIYRVFVNSLTDRNIDAGDTPTDFSIQLKQVLVPEVLSVHILTCVFPNSITPFSVYNNQFAFRDTTNSINYTLNLTTNQFFSDGSAFASYLQSSLNALTPGFTVSYSVATGKLSIINSLIGFQIFNDTGIRKRCQKRVGFYSASNPSTTVGVPLVADGLCYLLGTSVVYLTSNNLCSSQAQTGVNPSSATPPNNNILLQIPITASQFSVNTFISSYADLAFDIVNGSFNTIHFSLLDDDLQPINFAGSNIGFQLQLEISYGDSRYG